MPLYGINPVLYIQQMLKLFFGKGLWVDLHYQIDDNLYTARKQNRLILKTSFIFYSYKDTFYTFIKN
jgi:hypothetical protein